MTVVEVRWSARTKRRVALGLVVVLAALVAVPTRSEAAKSEKRYRIGMLDRTSQTMNAGNVDGFRQGLRELGYVEGHTFVIEYRSADGHDERFPALAAELVRARVDLIVTRGTPAALAAKQATSTIPIVITGVGDPVGQGVVASLARPGGNVTGMSAAVTDVFPKRVQLLKELAPRTSRIGVLFNMGNPALPAQWREVERGAQAMGVEAHLLDVRTGGDLEGAFDVAARQRVDALLVGIDTVTQANQALIVELAARRRLPAMYASAEFTGGLISYGVNYPEMYRRAATFAHKIFRGARPADLPVEEPITFELVINPRTARTLGLTIPPTLLVRADRLTEWPSAAPAPPSRTSRTGDTQRP